MLRIRAASLQMLFHERLARLLEESHVFGSSRSLPHPDIDSFDYGKFLKSRTNRPLVYEFENFQLRSAVEHISKSWTTRERNVATIPVELTLRWWAHHTCVCPPIWTHRG